MLTRSRLLALAITCSLVAAACGDDDGRARFQAAVAATTAATANTTAAAPVTPGAGSGGASDTSVAATCPPVDGSGERVTEFAAAPPLCIDTERSYRAHVVTNLGEVTIDLDTDAAPNAVNNFVVLARYHYFDDTPCHRIIPGFMAQCGDPTGTGRGGPGYRFADELPASSDAYTFGAVAMANAGPDTQGSQFFIVTAPGGYPLPPAYTVFGQVVDSDEALASLDAAGNPDRAANGVPPVTPVTIETVTITER